MCSCVDSWLENKTVGVFNEAISCVGGKFGITGKSHRYHPAAQSSHSHCLLSENMSTPCHLLYHSFLLEVIDTQKHKGESPGN